MKTEASLRVLLADDNRDLRGILAGFFRGRGYEVATVRSGEETMELLSRENFDVLVSDIVMPGVGGRAVIQLIEEVGVPLPVIVISAHVGCLDADRFGGMGVARVFAKPFDLWEMDRAVREVTGARPGADRFARLAAAYA